MNRYTGSYKGLACYCLENEKLKLTIVPELGAKIASLLYKPQNFEVLFQSKDTVYAVPTYGAAFAEYDTSGADEMFPTIDPCQYPYPDYVGAPIPDHGELWSIPWQVLEKGEGLTTEVKGVALPYVFRRSITLQGSRIHMEYKVSNTGVKPLYGLWAFHGLLACDEFTKILLPNVNQVITVHHSRLLGALGTRHHFPNTVSQEGFAYDLQKIAPAQACKTEKIYVEGPLTVGQAAVTLNQGQLLYKLLFPVHKVPYLGIWFNEGGFKNEYNCALEPSTGYYDCLEVSKQQESLQPLGIGDSLVWHLDIDLIAQRVED